jgi:hypothetical protein
MTATICQPSLLWSPSLKTIADMTGTQLQPPPTRQPYVTGCR